MNPLKKFSILIICLFINFSFQHILGQAKKDIYNLASYFHLDTVNGSLLQSRSPGKILEITDPNLIQKFTEHKYLVIQCEQTKITSGMVYIEFMRKNNETPSLQSKIGLLPGLPTFLVFPTSYLDGQQIFLPRYPRQLKGVVFGNRIDPGDLRKIGIFPAESPGDGQGIRVYRAWMTDELPDFNLLPSKIMVDKYGQWKGKTWKNKIVSDYDWDRHSSELNRLAGSVAQFPTEFSRFGGWKSLKFDSTGFFHTHFDGSRWWLVDPEGFAFLSYGMDCISPYEPTLLSGNESMFEYLPPMEGEFSEAYGVSGGQKFVDFFKVNMIRLFGAGWYDSWVRITINKLVDMNFNTVGNWSLERFSVKSGLPYVIPLSNFPRTEKLLYRDFPDVFSPEYKENAITFASQLESYKNDPLLIGYFLRNEPQWAFGNNNLAFEMMTTESPSYTRSALMQWLNAKYQSVDLLSKNWKMDFKDFSDIQSLILKDYPSDSCASDLWEFSKLMVKKYVDIVSEETRRVDPNHLNLGMRYAYISSDLLYTAGEAFDVFSINGYNSPGPPSTDEIYRRSGKPVMIGEFHFGATDRGLPSTGLRAVKNQKERGIAYRYYLEQGFSRPEIIGIHYFQWMDQSVMGRFDGENYNIGFNDVVYQGYDELERRAKKAHLSAYRVAAGKRKAFSRKPVEEAVIAF